jgi:prolyl oligopeptidase
LKLDGKNPTMLYGYGGFNISLHQVSASLMRYGWKMGCFSVPNLRGGGEYGKRWHDAGTKMQNKMCLTISLRQLNT